MISKLAHIIENYFESTLIFVFAGSLPSGTAGRHIAATYANFARDKRWIEISFLLTVQILISNKVECRTFMLRPFSSF